MASLNTIFPKFPSPLVPKHLIKPTNLSNFQLTQTQCPGPTLALPLSPTWRPRPSFVLSPQRTETTLDEPTETADAQGEGQLATAGGGGGRPENDGEEDNNKSIDRIVNAAIVLAAGSFAVTKLLTIDRDYWHGWTLYEILRYAPQHNWTAYEQILKTNPVFAKMVISGVVYSVGDWIAQCYEGKPLFDFDRTRMFRSGLTGFLLHGSLSHFYYEFCEALFPFQDWWAVPLKVAFDQTVWSAVWNSIYYTVLGLLRFESPANIFSELKATFWPMLSVSTLLSFHIFLLHLPPEGEEASKDITKS